jgi:putative nucleotidyltransferase with HDIG domain
MKRFVRFLYALKRRGIADAWLVGGVVRDFLMGREPTDVDIVCGESGTEALISKIGGVVVGKPPFCTVSTHLAGKFAEDCFSSECDPASFTGMNLEIALLTGGSIENDLGRRDFTINALAMDSCGNIIDPFGGARDIRRQILRLVPVSTLPYEADPVRVIRLLRFACTLNFTVDPETEAVTKKFIRERRTELENVSKERYGKEFLKAFSQRPHDFLMLLEDYGLLPTVLPDVETMRGVEQPPAFHPEGDVLAHTFQVMAEAQKVIQSHPGGKNLVLALAALLHDVGKPCSARPHPKYGHVCFFGHEETGERIAHDILSSWAMPGCVTSRVTALVRQHMIPGGTFTERTAVKLMRRTGAELSECLFDLALCDARGASGTGENILAARKAFYEVRENMLRTEEAPFKRWINGNDVMEILQIPSGREVGRILEELDVAVGSGKLHNREEAVEWLKSKDYEYPATSSVHFTPSSRQSATSNPIQPSAKEVFSR